MPPASDVTFSGPGATNKLMARRRTAARPPLYPRIPVADGEARGADGKKLRRGDAVRRKPHYSAALRCTVPGDVGRIEDVYRRSPDGPILIDVRRDRTNGAAGLATWPAADARRSAARVRGTTKEDWHGE